MMDSLQGDLGVQIVCFFQSGVVGKVLWYLFLPLHYIGSEKGLLFLVTPIYWGINKRLGKRLLILIVLGVIISGLFKIWWECPRPFHVSEGVIRYLTFTSEFGLPSGHTVFGTILGMTLLKFYKQNWQRFVCVLFVILMGISRLVHGMHFLQDVVVGWAIGLLIIYVALKYDEFSVHFINKQKLNVRMFYLSTVILFIILSIVIWKIEDLNLTLLSSLGGLIGGVVGLLLEKYDCEGESNKLRTLRIISGIIILVALSFILEFIVVFLASIFSVEWYLELHLLKYILLGFGVSFIIPYLLFKVNRFLLCAVSL